MIHSPSVERYIIHAKSLDQCIKLCTITDVTYLGVVFGLSIRMFSYNGNGGIVEMDVEKYR